MKNLKIKNNNSLNPCGKESLSGRTLLPKSGTDAPTVLSAVYTDSTLTKNRQADVPQYGRSMIEMLGVLAIIGVLSVGGIAGYSKAMTKYRVNKTIEQITLIAGNVRAFFASQRNYNDVANEEVLKKANIIPAEMWGTIKDHVSEQTWEGVEHVFGGEIMVYEAEKTSISSSHDAFVLIPSDLPQEACIELVTMDWRANSGSSIISIIVNANDPLSYIGEGFYTDTCESSNIAVCAKDMPMSIDKATSACKENNSITMKFY